MIYSLSSELDDFAYFVVPDDDREEQLQQAYFGLQSLAQGWTPPEVTISQSRKRLGDYPGIASLGVPVVSRRFLNALAPLISDKVEALPLGVFKRAEYFVLNVLDAVDAIDQEQSKYYASEYLPRGSLREAVYKPGTLEGRHFFRVDLTAPGGKTSYSEVLASEEFRQAVAQHELLGVSFRPFGTADKRGLQPTGAGEVEFDEAAYRARLPKSYRRLLENYPAELSAATADGELLASLDDAVELNREMRRLWPQSDYRKRPIALSYFLIGQDGCGDLYAIDLDQGESSPVLEFDHERAKWRPRAGSLEEFVDQMKELDA